jgi:histidinol-phosphate aminotransferase
MVAPQRLAAWHAVQSAPLVIDEAYVDFADADCLELVRGSERLLVTRSLSKSYSLAGIRFGFAIGAAPIIAQLYKVKDSYNCDVLSLAAATAALEDQAYMLANRARIIATRTRLTAALQELGFVVGNSQANFVWCRRLDRPVKPIYEELKQRKILVRYMTYAGYSDGLRITVGTEVETERLLEEMGRVV